MICSTVRASHNQSAGIGFLRDDRDLDMTWSTGSGNFFDLKNIKWNQLGVSVTTDII